MIGIIVCGHGHFATGLQSSISIVAGGLDGFKAVDFTLGMSTDELKAKLLEAISEVDKGDGVAVFTDIAGGAPFKQAALISNSTPDRKIKVVGGTNMPLLLDSIFLREKNLEDVISEAVELNKGSIKVFEMKQRAPQKEVDGDGI